MPLEYKKDKIKLKSDNTPDMRVNNGRPTKYVATNARQALKLCQMGATLADLADFFSVTVKTIQTWAHTYPEFEEAIRVGKDPADERVVMSLYMRAVGYDRVVTQDVLDKDGNIVTLKKTNHYPPDTTAMTYWLKNRRRTEWRDKHEIEFGMVGEFERMSDAELIEYVEGTVIEKSDSPKAITYSRDEEDVQE